MSQNTKTYNRNVFHPTVLKPKSIRRFNIEHQPQKYFRQRYQTEIKKTTHGTLKSDSSDQYFPTVSLCLTDAEIAELSQIVVFCLLYADPNANILADRLFSKGKETMLEPIPLQISDKEHNKYYYALKDSAILVAKKEDIKSNREEILNHLKQIPEWHKVVQFENENNTKRSKAVYLGFTVCKKLNDGTGYKLIEGPIFSHAVNSNSCKVNKLCNPSVPLHQGGELHFLMQNVTQDSEYKIKILRTENSLTIWEKEICKESVQLYVTNNAISFVVPPYDKPTNEQQIHCFLRINDAKPVLFSYINLSVNRAPESIKKRKYQTDSIQIKEHKPGNITEDFILNSIDDIDNLNEDFLKNYGKTIFHQAILNDELPIESSMKLEDLYETILNDEGQNLLHYACKKNKAKPIEYLGGLDNMLSACDNLQQTPLQIAIERRHQNCIEEFIKIFNKSNMSSLGKLLKILNSQYYSVLHLAVLYNEQELVKSMLNFCKRNEVDVEKLFEPKHGNTIIHLAKQKQFTEMVKLIQEILPESVTYKNYEE